MLRPGILLLLLAFLPVPIALAVDFDPAATATNQLGLELFRSFAAKNPGQDLLLSPYSIQSALAMTYAGADGQTRTEMARALHYPDNEAPLVASFGALRAAFDEAVTKSKEMADRANSNGGPIEPIDLRVANFLFGQRGYAFRDSFLAVTKGAYDATFEQLDFRADAGAARQIINRWVEVQTQQKIRDLIPADGVTARTRLVLVNAIYFKAPWTSPVTKSFTEDRPFFVHGTEPKNIPTMRQQSYLGYASFADFSAIALPYGYYSDDFQFLILLPNAATSLPTLTAKLTPAILHECAQLHVSSLILFLPKFRIAGPTLSLGETLQSFGMKSAFDQPRGSANFDRLAPRKPDDYLGISDVFHKTFLALDEDGTEAAAATAVALGTFGVASHSPPPEIHVDRPFLFAIQHRPSGTCLFLGCVTYPR